MKNGSSAIRKTNENVMPIDYKKYPKNWKTEIRPAVLERAGNKCEFCGIKNHSIIKRLPDGTWRSPCQTEWDMIYSRIKYCHSNMTESLKYHGFIRVVLTIAHLDHDECNHEVKLDRLAALCQLCHLRYDAKEKYRRVISNNHSRIKIMETQLIINAQAEVNRAVWAINLAHNNGKHSFKDDYERELYINICCKEAIKDLQEFLKDAECTLF